MSGPPEKVESSELWERIAAMPRPSKIVDFPRFDATGQPVARLAICVLTQHEQMKAIADAESFARKHVKPGDLEGRGYADLYANASAVEVLWRACRHVDDLKKNFFPTPHKLREMSVDEVAVLLQEYFVTQAELGPIIGAMSEEDVTMWIARLQEGAAGIPFARLSLDAQIDLVNSLVRRIVTYSTVISSSGLPLPSGGESSVSETITLPYDPADAEGASPKDPDEE